MTLSNFDWTDKTSLKWFILLPTGHEGPYSFESLINQKCPAETQIWAEGLDSPIKFKHAHDKMTLEVEMPLPPLPVTDEIPPIPLMTEEIREDRPAPNEERNSDQKKFPMLIFFTSLILLGAFLGGQQWLRSKESFTFHRAKQMSPELFQKITNEFKFEGWNKKLFLKEFVPADMSHIWLVTSSFHRCRVEAQFTSIKEKLLSMEDKTISFKSASTLENHILEFNRFEFIEGSRIIPGLYEMELSASQCEWGGMVPKIANLFKSPEPNYKTKMKVVLFHKGSREFNLILEKLIKQKIENEQRQLNQNELFWQDLQQKFQTMVAITLQIEQLFLEFLDKPSKDYHQNLKQMVATYTKNFGHFLTEFVVANEKYFFELEKSSPLDMGKKSGYESLVRVASKSVGFEAMKLIEEFQKMKKPTSKELKSESSKVKKRFDILKEGLNKKLIQITEDSATQK